MKRTQIFTLIMAIFWTVIGIAVVVLVTRAGLTPAMNILLVLMAFIAIVGNWMRWFRSR